MFWPLSWKHSSLAWRSSRSSSSGAASGSYHHRIHAMSLRSKLLGRGAIYQRNVQSSKVMLNSRKRNFFKTWLCLRHSEMKICKLRYLAKMLLLICLNQKPILRKEKSNCRPSVTLSKLGKRNKSAEMKAKVFHMTHSQWPEGCNYDKIKEWNEVPSIPIKSQGLISPLLVQLGCPGCGRVELGFTS